MSPEILNFATEAVFAGLSKPQRQNMLNDTPVMLICDLNRSTALLKNI